MPEHFSDAARDVITRAQEEARALSHDHLGTEHLLLGMINEPGLAGDALAAMGLSSAAARRAVLRIAPRDRRTPDGDIPLTRNARTVLADAEREVRVFGDDRVRPEHLLVALTRVGEGVAVRVIGELIGDVSRLRADIVRRIDNPQASPRLDLADRIERLEAEVGVLRRQLDTLTGAP